MFSNLSRCVAILALVGSASALGSPAGAATAVPSDWMDPVTLAPVGAEDLRAVVSDTGDMAVVWERSGAIEAAVRPAGGDWVLPATVVASAHSDVPLAAYDGAGRLLVVWAWSRAGDPPRVMARVMDDTGTWADPVQVAHRASGTLRAEDLAVNAKGDAVVGWLWRNRALVSRGSLGGGWTTAAAWTKTLTLDVALGDRGLAAAMLQRWVGPRTDDVTLTFEVARQTRAGVWGATRVLQTVDQSPPWVGPGGVAVDAKGVTTVAWQRVTAAATRVVAVRAGPGRAFGAPVVLGRQPTRTEWAVRVLATPAGDVLVTWVHNGVADVKAVRRPAGGPWSEPVVACGGQGVVMDWDVALAHGGRAVVAVSKAAHFAADYGTRTCFMGRAGHWAAPTQVTAAVDGPRVGLGDTDGLVAWLASPGVRARATEG